jgi:[2-(trimethylamino)ethyl]phosphonate dioxygenase
MLSGYYVCFEYLVLDGVCLTSRPPVIELKPDGELTDIRFNDRSNVPLIDVSFEKVPNYFKANRILMEHLENPDYEIRFRIRHRDLIILDNTRIVHAHNAFSSKGSRWLQGCYADQDGLLSTLRSLEF